MDGVGGEVSHKIKAAIKAKLIELGAYVDDELPDYIMVMVANKRNRKQMEDDLSLFLNNNTKVFTAWLHTVLQKLQEVTVASKGEKKELEAKKSSKKNRSNSVDSKKNSKSSKEKHDKSTKKKHKDKDKRHKEKKAKKPKRIKSKSVEKEKETKSVESRDLSDWEDDAVPVLPKSALPIKTEATDEFDVSKEVGRAIIGNLKEKHKVTQVEPCVEPVEVAPADIPPPSPNPMDTELPPVVETTAVNVDDDPDEFKLSPVPPEKPPSTHSSVKDVVEEAANDDVSITEVATASAENKESEPTVMVPTLELLKEHDKLIQESVKKDLVDTRAVSHVSSDSSVSPEELRRQLLLSRAKKKMEERNMENRMRSHSPEIIIVEERSQHKLKEPSPVPPQVLEPVQKQPVSVQIRRSESKSSRLSLHASSFGSASVRKNSPPSPRRNTQDVRSKVRVVSRPEPEEPGVSSVVQVKPREFGPPEKQANKNLILKAVAAAERSVANLPARKNKSPSPKAGQRPKALYTKDLRSKRFQNFEVTLANNGEKSSLRKDRLSEKSTPCKHVEENFISSKTSTKDRNETFIKTWLEEVEEAGKNDELIKPNEISPSGEGVDLVEDSRSVSDNEPIEDASQIVVTLGGLRGARKSSCLDRHQSPDANRISDRFGKIVKEDDDHEFKAKFLEFERKRAEKRKGGESKNKKLIAQLSMKFGQIDRVFDDENSLGIRRRLGYLDRAFHDGEKGLMKRKDGRDNDAKEEKRVSRLEKEADDGDVRRRQVSRDEISLDRQDRSSKNSSQNKFNEARDGYESSKKRSYINEADRKKSHYDSENERKRGYLDVENEKKRGNYDSDTGRKRTNYDSDTGRKRINYDSDTGRKRINYDSDTNRKRINYDSDIGRKRNNYDSDTGRKRGNYDGDTEKNRSDHTERTNDERTLKKRKISQSDLSEEDERSTRKRRSDENPRKRDRSDLDESPRKDKRERRIRVSADYDEVEKSKDRCRYWPECARGDSCDFHHPSSICKSLPHCKFKEECLYIHPLCKNDRDCTLKDCAYEHSNRTNPTTHSRSRDSIKMLCKYDSYCKSADCPYQHTKKSCKFGSRCKNRDCSYSHTNY